MALAGFSAGEAEGLRRAMSRKRSDAALRAYRGRFVEGAVAKGVEPRRSRAASSTRSRASPASASRSPTRPPSACSPTSRPGCGSTTGRVPLRAAERAADGLLPARRARPRGAAARDRGAGPDVNASTCSAAASGWATEPARSAGGPDRPRLHQGPGRGATPRRSSRRAGARRPTRDLGDLASRSGASRDGLERLAWAGACASIGAADGAGRGPALDRRSAALALGISRGTKRTASAARPGASSCRCRSTCPRRRRSPSRAPGSG